MNGGIVAAQDAIAGAAAVLFDFDGPLCDVFAGMPAPTVARRLAAFAGLVVDTDDPLQVLRHAAEKLDADKLRKVEDMLICAEVGAISLSKPTRGGREVVRQLIRSGHRVGVVSNNSAQAVAAFLERHGLLADVGPVVGRPYAQPELMKPNPWPLLRALEEMGDMADRTIFIGDSLTDIEAAYGADIPCIAVANKPGKWAQFTEGRTLAVVANVFDLLVTMA